MAEAGGPAAQAGIYYQNSIAALYMGRMLDTRSRAIRERVSSVRVGAPGHVDDVVVRLADGSSRMIQAKLTIRQADAAWSRLWSNLSAQLELADRTDRLALVVGEPNALSVNLQECAARTTGSSASEWLGRLTKDQRSIVNGIGADLGFDTLRMFDIFRQLDVEIITERMLERDLPAIWMPDVSAPETMHSLLRTG